MTAANKTSFCFTILVVVFLGGFISVSQHEIATLLFRKAAVMLP